MASSPAQSRQSPANSPFSTIVGYQNKDTRSVDYTMAGASFVTVGGTNQVTLADISVGYGGDYQKPEWDGDMWNGWTDAVFMLKLIDQNGATIACYTWIDKPLDEFEYESEWVKGWAPFTTSAGDILTAEQCRAIEFTSGQGFWIYGAGMTLVSNGQVGDMDINFQTRLVDYTAVCNGTGRDWTLGDVSVGYGGDYQEPTWDGDMWNGWTDAVFMLKDIDQNGATITCYTWIDKPLDEFEYESDWVTGWAPFTTSAGEILTPEELAEIAVPAGQGYWVYGAGMVLKFKKAIQPIAE